MSELKTILATPHPKMKNACDGAIEVYLKSEVDKVIAELKKEIEEQKQLRNMALSTVPNVLKVAKIIQHHKHKRCLAIAKRCKDKIENVVQYNEHDDWLIINEYWERWYKRWLQLAEKFNLTMR